MNKLDDAQDVVDGFANAFEDLGKLTTELFSKQSIPSNQCRAIGLSAKKIRFVCEDIIKLFQKYEPFEGELDPSHLAEFKKIFDALPPEEQERVRKLFS